MSLWVLVSQFEKHQVLVIETPLESHLQLLKMSAYSLELLLELPYSLESVYYSEYLKKHTHHRYYRLH